MSYYVLCLDMLGRIRTFFAYYYLKVHFYHSSQIESHEEVTKQ
jgi:hypothetical protein